jgi:hypothetical protein
MNNEALILRCLELLSGSAKQEPTVDYAQGSGQVHPRVGQFCIVRCRDAGVWAGTVKAVRGLECEIDLVNARQMWKWRGEFVLPEIARNGPIPSKDNRYSVIVPEHTLGGWCQIMPCTEIAKEKILGVPNAKPM